MHCLDTSALVDYLHGHQDIGAFIESRPVEPIFAPSVALSEVFVGAVRTRGDGGLGDIQDDLEWLEPIPLSVEAAMEAVRVDGELHGSGEPIRAVDTLVAGVVRNKGGSLVTRNAHFVHVDGLDIHRFDM